MLIQKNIGGEDWQAQFNPKYWPTQLCLLLYLRCGLFNSSFSLIIGVSTMSLGWLGVVTAPVVFVDACMLTKVDLLSNWFRLS